MGQREVRIEFQCFLVLSYSIVIAMAEIVNPTKVRVDNQRERIEFTSPLDVCERLCISSDQRQRERNVVMPRPISGIKADRAFVFGKAFFPPPLEGVDLSHRRMSLSQGTVKPDSLSGGRLQLRYSLARWHRNIPDRELVRLGQITIGQSIAGIDLYGLLEKLNRFHQTFCSTLAHVVSALQVSLVRCHVFG